MKGVQLDWGAGDMSLEKGGGCGGEARGGSQGRPCFQASRDCGNGVCFVEKVFSV